MADVYFVFIVPSTPIRKTKEIRLPAPSLFFSIFGYIFRRIKFSRDADFCQVLFMHRTRTRVFSPGSTARLQIYHVLSVWCGFHLFFWFPREIMFLHGNLLPARVEISPSYSRIKSDHLLPSNLIVKINYTNFDFSSFSHGRIAYDALVALFAL